MYFGLSSLASYGFLGGGFWVVMCAGIGLGLVYAVGSARGKRAAQQWVRACLMLLGVGGVADIAWAVLSRQWHAFLLQFGFGPVAEMLVLALLFIGTMLFMAIRYIGGMDE